MVDIIIPAYNSHKTIDKTLSSISLQSIIKDIKVYIVNDGSDKDYQESIDFYKDYMDITELSYKENKGPGFAREYGIEHSSSDYIVFIDSDDTLYDSNSIAKLLNTIKSSDYDFVNSVFIEQADNEIKKYYDDVVWLHGKIYKRSFLEKNNIKFNDSRSNEDNGFNTLLLLNKPKEKYLEEPTYIWINNGNSITRRNNKEHKYLGVYGYIYNICWALEQKKDNPLVSRIAFAALYTVYLKYIEFDDKEDSLNIIKESKRLFNLYKIYELSDSEKLDLLTLQFESLYKTVSREVLLKPYISFTEFLRMVGDSK